MKPLRPSRDPAVRKRALDLLAAGELVTNIAIELGVHRSTVHKWQAEPKPVEGKKAPAPYATGYLYPGGRGRRWE
jgi:transposase